MDLTFGAQCPRLLNASSFNGVNLKPYTFNIFFKQDQMTTRGRRKRISPEGLWPYSNYRMALRLELTQGTGVFAALATPLAEDRARLKVVKPDAPSDFECEVTWGQKKRWGTPTLQRPTGWFSSSDPKRPFFNLKHEA